MKYFLHDSNAFNDEKITELYINFGYEGLGLFYTILEKLAGQEKPVKTLVLKKQLNVGKKLEKCWKFMESIDIISSNNGETFNKQLLNFSEKYKIKKEKNAKRISEWRENQSDTKDVTHYESVRNSPKVKESKVKESKDIKERKIEFKETLNPYLEKYGKQVLTDFYYYWTELDKSGKKMRYESEKFFEVQKRIATWYNRSLKSFDKTKLDKLDKPNGVPSVTTKELPQEIVNNLMRKTI